MSGAHFTLTLDTTPPVAPVMLIDDGADRTGSQTVLVALNSTSTDVRDMKVWGDVDPTFDLNIAEEEADSAWVLYNPEAFPVRLSTGQSRKHLYARLRDDVNNASPAFTDWIDLDLSVPVVSVVVGPTRTKVSKVAPTHETIFGWTCSQVFDQFEVRVVPTAGSPRVAGAVVPTTFGSSGTAGTLDPAGGADTVRYATVRGADVQAISPGDGPKVVKVFARTPAGKWSA